MKFKAQRYQVLWFDVVLAVGKEKKHQGGQKGGSRLAQYAKLLESFKIQNQITAENVKEVIYQLP